MDNQKLWLTTRNRLTMSFFLNSQSKPKKPVKVNSTYLKVDRHNYKSFPIALYLFRSFWYTTFELITGESKELPGTYYSLPSTSWWSGWVWPSGSNVVWESNDERWGDTTGWCPQDDAIMDIDWSSSFFEIIFVMLKLCIGIHRCNTLVYSICNR